MRSIVGRTYRPAEQEYTRLLGQLLIHIRTIRRGSWCGEKLTTKDLVGLLIRDLNAELLQKGLARRKGRLYWVMVLLRLP